jgi:hypothetical protein
MFLLGVILGTLIAAAILAMIEAHYFNEMEKGYDSLLEALARNEAETENLSREVAKYEEFVNDNKE